MSILIRPSSESDLDAITAIYAHAVIHGTASFELDPPDRAEMARRRSAILEGGYPYLAAEKGGAVLGYAYAGAYRTRPAYRSTVEDSIYIAPQSQGQGIGRLLLTALIEQCEARDFRLMVAVIGDEESHGPIGLHRSLGFEPDGYLIYGRDDLRVPVKRPNIHGKIPLIRAEETYYAADLEVPGWTLVSCEF